ncbi:MAG: SDR family oxidoreductase [Aestuariivirga sp.]|uniref:SDR family oxidoreductase n=1 Tax=Aestuariivirga sp. TaxID=2650926 RepID=UPI0030169650
MNHILFFGLGFSAKALAERLAAKGWTVSATSRSAQGAAAINDMGYRGLVFDGSQPLPAGALDGVTHVVDSAPPGDDGDPVLRQHAADFAARAGQFQWVAYLSTTGVYGDHAGGLVTEETPLTPNTERGHKRLLAETQWLDLWRAHGLPVMIFRLAGIYGPGRNQLLSLLDGSAKRVIKPRQIFSRIHVADIANTLEASIAHPDPGRAYNVCDDEACPPQDVVEYGAKLLGLPVPPDVPFEEASLSPMAKSFYADSKRVSNERILKELGVKLSYPSYREGLAALANDLRR